jgi:peptidoglycan/LPS O-acetylase OafA/YrhL
MPCRLETNASSDIKQITKGDSLATMKYRPDIDGLRAIAVLSVIIFHINDKLLPGGFVGVE